jgi:hypothetical protein
MLGSMRSLACLALLSVAAGVGAATAYKSVGPGGSVIYSDRPEPGSEAIRIPEPSSYAPRATPVAAPESPPALAPTDVYSAIRISKPEADATVHAGASGVDVDVDVLLEPALREGDTLTYSVDGKETAKGLTTNRVRVTDLERGTHHLEVTVRDESGALVGRSPRVTFHVRRPSVNDLHRRDKGTAQPANGPVSNAPAAPAGYGPPAAPTYAPTQGQPAYAPPVPSYAPSYTPPSAR